jgi:group I intron endonuclease
MIYYQIYCTINNLNNKIYIGQHKTNSFKKKNYLGSGIHLNRAIKKYGSENFSKNILEVCETKEQADWYEKRYISFYRLGGKAEYNIADGGQGGNLGEIVNKKLSDCQKGEKAYWYGKSMPEETKKKISEAEKGKKRRPKTEQEKLNISIAVKKAMENDDVKLKCKEGGYTHRGRHQTKEWKEKRLAKISKKVFNIDTGEVFNSISSAGQKYGGRIADCCNGKTKVTNNYHWKYI